MLRTVFFILTLCALLPLPGHAAGTDATAADNHAIRVGVPTDVLHDYRLFLIGRDPLSIVDYGGLRSRRDVVEVVLFQQALALGGFHGKIDLIGSPTYERIIAEVRDGHLSAAATSIWKSDLDKHPKRFLVTSPVIENGQFEAGLYTAPNNSKALEVTCLSQVRELTAVSNRNWTPDWMTLTALDLKELRHIQNWHTMVRIVANGRTDFLLAPFQQSKGMRLHVDGMILAPIRGVKVGLIGSRHFAVSKSAPGSDRLFAALERGVGIMKRRNTFEKAYRQSGFFNAEAGNWLLLNSANLDDPCGSDQCETCDIPDPS